MKNELIVEKNPKSPTAEMFRTLRTNILFMNSKKNLRTIVVTSTKPSEGKSMISSNLAITFAQAGKKVVLVDADMRKGKLASLFQVTDKPGLSNYLSGIDGLVTDERTEILKYVKTTEIENLYLIPAGNVPPNPAELLGTEQTTMMIDSLKENFDIIILDGTPSLLVTDAVVLSSIVDTTIVVAEYKSTKKEDLQKIIRSIKNVGGNIAGVVLNKIPISPKAYKSSYYYGEKNRHEDKESIDDII